MAGYREKYPHFQRRLLAARITCNVNSQAQGGRPLEASSMFDQTTARVAAGGQDAALEASEQTRPESEATAAQADAGAVVTEAAPVDVGDAPQSADVSAPPEPNAAAPALRASFAGLLAARKIIQSFVANAASTASSAPFAPSRRDRAAAPCAVSTRRYQHGFVARALAARRSTTCANDPHTRPMTAPTGPSARPAASSASNSAADEPVASAA